MPYSIDFEALDQFVLACLRRSPGIGDSCWSNPAIRTVSTSPTAPACDTIAVPAVSVRTRGYSPILFTLKVLLARRDHGLDNPDPVWLGALFS